jgi:DoxX-like family
MAMPNKLTIAGWILSFLMAVLFTISASAKLVDWEGKEAEFAKSGFTILQMKNIGIVEIVITIIYLFPPTSFLGAILLTGYLGGAIVTHVRLGDPFFVQIVIGVLVWVGYWLRRPDVIKAAFSKKLTT